VGRAEALTRARAVNLSISAALVAWVISAWFGVNGPNYEGWSRTFAVFSLIILLALVVVVIRRPTLTRRRLMVAAAALGVVAVLAGVSIHWYGDGTPRSDIPSILAWIGLVALAVAAAALSIPSRSRNGGVRP
jgi:hypothetical protein